VDEDFAQMTATWLYCLAKSDAPPSLRKGPRGVPHASQPRAIDAGDGFWLVASDAPLEKYGEGPIEKGLQDLQWVSSVAVPHEAVIEHVAKTATVIPMKLFTLFHSDARALEHVKKQRRQLERLAVRLEGREEWGVRMTLDEGAALRKAHREAQAGSKGSPGAAFLLRKKKELDAANEVLLHARERADELFETLRKKGDDGKRRPPPPGEIGRRVLLDAAFLVKRGKQKPFANAVKQQAKQLHKFGYDLVLTGPWPPYNFIGESP
jgi:hypothetical protein